MDMISDELQCVFVHCQKCAGESIEKAVFGYADKNYGGDMFAGSPEKHYSASQYIAKIGQENWDAYFTFAFVRNPWDRVISWIKYRDLRFGRLEELNPKKIETEIQQPMFKKFSYKNMLFDVNGKCLVDFIGSFENIDSDFESIKNKLGISGNLPMLNKTHHDPYWMYYNEATIDLVSKLYRDDIKQFGFEFGKNNYRG
jgi:hypothetical protein